MRPCSLKPWKQTMPHSRKGYSLICQSIRRPFADNGISHSDGFPITTLTRSDRFRLLFYDTIPAEYHLRVWDVFLFEGINPTTFIIVGSTHDGDLFRGPILVPRWSSTVYVLPTSVVGSSKSRPGAFHLVSGSYAMSSAKRRCVNRVGDIKKVEG